MPDYLSEKDWAAELKKVQGAKDPGLAASLSAWAKSKGKDPDQRSKALEAVIAKATAAQKQFKGEKELGKFATAAAAKAKEELKKVAEEAKEKEDEGEDGDGIDKDLAKAVRRAKTGRMFAAILVKGDDSRLILSKVKVKPAAIAAVKKEIGGGRLIRAVCFGEEGVHVFEMVKDPPATLERIIKRVVKERAGLMIRVECRKVSKSDDLENEEGEEEGDDETAETGNEPTAEKPAAGPKAAFDARIAKMTPELKQVLQLKNDFSEKAKLAFSESQVFMRKEDFAKANGKLDDLAAIIRQALGAAGGNDPKKEWTARVAELTPQLKTALQAGGELANKVKQAFAKAQTSAKEEDYAKALALLDDVSELINGDGAGTEPSRDGLAAEWAKKLADLTPDLKKVLVQKGPLADRVKTEMGAANTLAKGKDFAQAIAKLDGIADDVRKAAAGGGAPPPPPVLATQSPEEIAVRTRMNALSILLPKAKRLDTTGQIADLEALIKEAREVKDFATALKQIDKLEPLVKKVVPPPKKVGEKIAFAQARLGWSRARTDALASLNNFCNKLKAERPEEADLANVLVKSLDGFDDRLYAAIKDAEQAAADAEAAQGTEKETATKELTGKKAGIRSVLNEYLLELGSSPVIKHLDANPMVSLNLRETLTDPLTALAGLVKA